MSTFDFMQNPIMPGQMPQPQMQQYAQPQPMYNQMPYPQQQSVVYAPEPETPKIASGNGGLFTVIPDEPSGSDAKNIITIPAPDAVAPEELGLVEKKPRRRKKADNTETVNDTEIIRAEGQVVEDLPTMYSYAETTNMTRQTIQQLDMLASEIKNELDYVRSSRTMKRKYDYITGLSSNLGTLLGTKLTAIREINSSISKSNEMDYKREKDRKISDTAQNDDKYIMDLYNAFIANPGNIPGTAALGPNIMDATVAGSGIVRAASQDAPENSIADAGYLNYVSNMTPEQKMMYMEHDPNIKQVVVYDASTGNKFFQVMNVSTGQAVTGVPVRDQMFMEDTTIDLRNKIAKNLNLNETYPVIVINDNVAKEY